MGDNLRDISDRCRKVMHHATQQAVRFNHEYVGTEHILLGLIKSVSGIPVRIMEKLGCDPQKIRFVLEMIVPQGPDMVTMGKLLITPRAKKAVEYAIEEAHNLNNAQAEPEHLLIGLIRENDGVAGQLLIYHGLSLFSVREEVRKATEME